MSSIPVEVIESRLDYLTITCTDPPNRNHFFTLGQMLVASAKTEGGKEIPFRAKGYQGIHAGWATFGRRTDSDIIQLSGAKADEWFDTLYVVADNVSRLDLCVTVRLGEADGGIAKQAASDCEAWKSATGRTLDCTALEKNGYVNTAYFGQRISDIFGRIYDKHLESGIDAYRQCWRYEVEAKGHVAYRTAKHLHSHGDRQRCVLAAVRHYYVNRGVRFPVSGDSAELHLQTIRAPSDADTRLRWLRESVRPAVQWLLANNRADEVWEALGIPRSVSERYRLWKLLFDDAHRNELFDGQEGASDDGGQTP